MLSIFVTLDVFKLDKSKEVNDEQATNMSVIVVTLDVLKLDKSKEVKFKQLENIYDIVLTQDVSKFDNETFHLLIPKSYSILI